jgi:hypothetical protein
MMGCAGCGQSGGGCGSQSGGCAVQTRVQTPNLSTVNSNFATSPEGKLVARKGLENHSHAAESVVQLSGEVIDVYQISSQRGLRSGVHVLLQTNGDIVEVRLGPSRYLEDHQFSLEPDDWIVVEGTRTDQARDKALMAYQVTRGEQVLVLRDENGMPLWRSNSGPQP